MKKFMLSRLLTMGVLMVSVTALWGNERIQPEDFQKKSPTQEAVEIASVNEGLLNNLGNYFRSIAQPVLVRLIEGSLPETGMKEKLLKGEIPLPQPYLELENTICKEIRRLCGEIYSKEELQGIYDFCRHPQAMPILRKTHQFEFWDDIRYGISQGNLDAQESDLIEARRLVGSLGEETVSAYITSIEPIVTHFVNVMAIDNTRKGAIRETENKPWDGTFQDKEWNWVVKSRMTPDITAGVSAMGGSAQALNLVMGINGLSGFHMTDLDPAVWQRERICHHAVINRYHRVKEICGEFFPQYQEFALKYREKGKVMAVQFSQNVQMLYLNFLMQSMMRGR